jgi:endonuclease/exonuclease/phosphatase family metal-dependent hydrolase
VVMNTHLDDQGVVARQKSAEIIVDRANAFLASRKYEGVLLTGDFNSEPSEEAYRTIQFADNSPFEDVAVMFEEGDVRRQGHFNTFTASPLLFRLFSYRIARFEIISFFTGL